LYSIPGFWLATVLVVFFTTPEYGAWTDIFPSVGIWDATSTDTQWQIIAKNADLLILPIVVLSTGFMAYLTRIVRNAVIEEKHKTYVVHARNKGLSEKSILWRHVFRNASFPLITLLGSILPAALAGSVVIEVICNVPGTGRLLFDSIMNQDWPVVIGVVLISSVLTIIGLLISDILYQWADPRVNFSRA
ncbi:MAG: ABC transporter permease, partial [Saprospiraceae bacterium]|nr:ABC transporter permease [Saprospiraceae bacterium]